MNWVEIAGFVTGAVCVWLATRQHVANFPVGIANNVLYAVLFWRTGLPANATLQVVFLVLAALGWYWWVRGGPDAGRLPVRRTTRRHWALAGLATTVLAVVLAVVLWRTVESQQPWADATTTALSVVAQVMMGRKLLGSWGLWILTDVLLVALYASVGLYLTAGLYALFALLCVHGWRRWARELRAVAEPEPEPVGA